VVCGALGAVLEDCGSQGLECAEEESACRCPPGGPVFAVDPAHSGEGGLDPTGAETNPGCGFGTLRPALAAAGTWAAANGPATVRALSVPAGGSFGPTAGDELPIVVPPDVTLESAPQGWVIGVESAVNGGTDPAIVRLEAGAALRGFTIRNQVEPPAASPSGAGVHCDAGGALSNVAVETNNLSWGVHLTGGCAATVDSVAVEGPRRAALLVETPGVSSEVVGGSYRGQGSAAGEPGHGVWVRSGGVAIRSLDGVAFSQFDGVFTSGTPVELSGSTGSGLRADKDTSGATISIEVERARIVGNGAAGMYLDQLPDTSSVSIRSSQIEGNAPSGYYAERMVGGIMISSGNSVPQVTFKGNRVWRNGGDQIGLWLPSDTLVQVDLSGGDPLVACDAPENRASANVIGRCLTGEDVFSTTSTTPVSAVRNYWQGNSPVVTNASVLASCSWASPSCP
jgi:hypothetical protein